MVFFTCNSCGTAVKKNQVEKHWMGCRSGRSLSCIDCNKDFFGNAYNEHTSCISEDQKYGGVNYQAKEGANKNQKKQDMWIENLRAASSSGPPNLRTFLRKILEYPNVPRKQAKFANFSRSCLGIKNDRVIQELWQVVEEANKSNVKNPAPEQSTPTDAAKRPAESELEESNGTAKRTKLENDEGVVALDARENSNGASKQFKWEKAIKRILKNQDSGELPLKKLRKQLKQIYKDKTSESLSKAVFSAGIETISQSKFAIEDKKIRIAITSGSAQTVLS